MDLLVFSSDDYGKNGSTHEDDTIWLGTTMYYDKCIIRLNEQTQKSI